MLKTRASVRGRSAPQRFSDETFKSGANNKYTVGREVDAGHVVEAWGALHDHMKGKERYDVHRVESAERVEGAAFIVESDVEESDVEDSDMEESDMEESSDEESDDEEKCDTGCIIAVAGAIMAIALLPEAEESEAEE